MKNYILLVLITSLFLGCGKHSEDNKSEMQRHIKSANVYVAQGQIRAAMLEAKNAINKEPDLPDGFLVMAGIYNRIGAFSSNQSMLEPLVAKMPILATDLADAYLNLKKYNTALELINKYPVGEDRADLRKRQMEITALANIYLGEQQGFQVALANFQGAGANKQELTFINASNLLAKGKIEEANSLLDAALKEAPEDKKLLRLAGGVNLYSHQLSKAEGYLTKALTLLPSSDIMSVDRSQVLSLLTDTLIQEGRTSEAYTYQKILADANPEGNAAQQRFNEALELYQQGNFAKAETILNELREQFPNEKNSGTLLGLIEFQQGADEKAANLFDEFIDPETASSSVIQAAALVKFRNNKVDEALELLKKATESQPNNAQLLATYGLAVLDVDPKSAQGAKSLEKSLAIDPSHPRIRLALAKRYMALGQPEQALGQLQKAYQAQPLDLIVQQSYLKALFELKQDDRVKAEILDFQKSYPDSARGSFIEGWYFMERKDYGNAEKAFEKSVANKNNTEKELAYSALAQIYELKKNPQKAVAYWQQALAAKPAVVSIYSRWLSQMLELNRQDEAKAFLQKLESESGAWQPSLVLAEIYARAGDLLNAIAHCEKAVEKSNSVSLTKQKLAVLYQAEGSLLKAQKKFEDARGYFLKATELFPKNINYVGSLIEIELAAKNTKEAQSLLDQFPDDDSTKAEKIYYQAAIDFSNDDKQNGFKHLQESWNLKPTEKAAEVTFAYYQSQGSKDLAKQFVTEWTEKLPKSYKGSFIRATLYQAENDKAEAIEWYKKSLELSPNSVIPLNNLAWLYYEKKDNQALPLAKRAASLAPKAPAVLDTYGWILVESGQLEEGISILEKALAFDPEAKDIKEHLKLAKERSK